MHFFPENTALKYRYEIRYRTATIMEEDALKQPTASGEMIISCQTSCFCPMSLKWFQHFFCFHIFTSDADLSLHALSENPCGSLVVYVIPESSSLLSEVKILFHNIFPQYYLEFNLI